MKGYIQGLITGASLVFGFMVLTGSNADAYNDNDDTKYEIYLKPPDLDEIYTKLKEIESNVLNDMDFNVREIRAKVNTIETNVRLIEYDVTDIESAVDFIKTFGVECN